MDFDKYIPKDPTLMRKLERAFKRALADYDSNIDKMEEYDDQMFEVPPEQRGNYALVDAYDREVPYYPPDMMRDYREHMTRYWDDVRRGMKQANTAQEQMGIVFGLIKESFAVAAYTGACPLMPQVFDEVVNQTASAYEDNALSQRRAENEAADNIERIGPSQRAFMQQSLGDLCNYSQICLESLADIELLARHYDLKHGITGEDVAETPYDVMLRRYCAARGIEDMRMAQVPDEDKEEFFKDEVKFFQKELYGPFRELFPDDRACPEMAWFIAASIDAVRIEEVEGMYERDQPKPRAVPNAQKIRLTSANDNNGSKPSFVDIVSKPRSEFFRGKFCYGDNDVGRSDEEILSDPAACARMKDILEDVLSSYPAMATKFADMLAAKEYMQHMYLGVEPEPEVGLSR